MRLYSQLAGNGLSGGHCSEGRQEAQRKRETRGRRRGGHKDDVSRGSCATPVSVPSPDTLGRSKRKCEEV